MSNICLLSFRFADGYIAKQCLSEQQGWVEIELSRLAVAIVIARVIACSYKFHLTGRLKQLSEAGLLLGYEVSWFGFMKYTGALKAQNKGDALFVFGAFDSSLKCYHFATITMRKTKNHPVIMINVF